MRKKSEKMSRIVVNAFLVFSGRMSPCPGNNKREEKEIPTKISNVIESVVCDI